MSVVTCLLHRKINLGYTQWKTTLWVKCWPCCTQREFSSLHLIGFQHYSIHPSSPLPTTIVLGLCIINFSKVNPSVASISESRMGEWHVIFILVDLWCQNLAYGAKLNVFFPAWCRDGIMLAACAILFIFFWLLKGELFYNENPREKIINSSRIYLLLIANLRF